MFSNIHIGWRTKIALKSKYASDNLNFTHFIRFVVFLVAYSGLNLYPFSGLYLGDIG